MIEAFELAYKNRKKAAGKIYNIGGGPQKTVSLHELIALIEDIKGEKIPMTYDDWRPGDQKIFVGNIRKAENELGWTPKVKPKDGVKKLYNWVNENIEMLGTLNNFN